MQGLGYVGIICRSMATLRFGYLVGLEQKDGDPVGSNRKCFQGVSTNGICI